MPTKAPGRSRASSSRFPRPSAYAAHPHITLLAPFRPRALLDDPALRTDLKTFFGAVAPMSFALVEVRRFPVGIDYLAPEPAEPFRVVTLALARSSPTARRTADCSTT